MFMSRQQPRCSNSCARCHLRAAMTRKQEFSFSVVLVVHHKRSSWSSRPSSRADHDGGSAAAPRALARGRERRARIRPRVRGACRPPSRGCDPRAPGTGPHSTCPGCAAIQARTPTKASSLRQPRQGACARSPAGKREAHSRARIHVYCDMAARSRMDVSHEHVRNNSSAAACFRGSTLRPCNTSASQATRAGATLSDTAARCRFSAARKSSGCCAAWSLIYRRSFCQQCSEYSLHPISAGR
jgi:hypothetical protein